MDVAPREDVVAALAAQVDELDGLVAHLDEAGWTRASACAGWTVADVLVHLAQTNEVAQASLENRWETVLDHWGGSGGEGTVDDLAAAAVERSVIRRGPEVYRWWKATADAVVGAFAATDPRARVQWDDPLGRDVDPHDRRGLGPRRRGRPHRTALAHRPPRPPHHPLLSPAPGGLRLRRCASSCSVLTARRGCSATTTRRRW